MLVPKPVIPSIPDLVPPPPCPRFTSTLEASAHAGKPIDANTSYQLLVLLPLSLPPSSQVDIKSDIKANKQQATQAERIPTSRAPKSFPGTRATTAQGCIASDACLLSFFYSTAQTQAVRLDATNNRIERSRKAGSQTDRQLDTPLTATIRID